MALKLELALNLIYRRAATNVAVEVDAGLARVSLDHLLALLDVPVPNHRTCCHHGLQHTDARGLAPHPPPPRPVTHRRTWVSTAPTATTACNAQTHVG